VEKEEEEEEEENYKSILIMIRSFVIHVQSITTTL
jgi:hypothetical protein